MPLSALAAASKSKVVVIGGGYGGATAAKYIRMLSQYRIDVTLVEPHAHFVSCPMSNLVVGGVRHLGDITWDYSNLSKNHGVKVVRDFADRIHANKRVVRLGSGKTLPYDKLVLSPGIELMTHAIEGLDAANSLGATIQAWKAGTDTLTLRKQLEAMPNGGTYVISIPLAPYRCPPGPYERACMVAHYLKQYKPRSKVIVLDANPEVTSKGALFKAVWANQYKGMVEYRPNHKVVGVDGKTKTLRFEFDDPLRAHVLNVLPDMRAGTLAIQSGLANVNGRWAGVNFQTFESTVAPHVFVIGDAIQTAPLMPKSGHMANSQAKVAAAAIVSQLSGWAPNPTPMLNNTCYSYINNTQAMHITSVHRYDAQQKTFLSIDGAGGVSSAPSELEGLYAWSWAQTMWADSLG